MGLGERAAKLTYRGTWHAWAATRKAPRIEVICQRGVGVSGGVREYVHRVAEPAYVEPEFGYVMTERGHWLEQSLTPNFEDPITPWRIATPAPWRWLQARQRRTSQVREFDCVISLRHLWEWNYYHFYLDALGKLSLLDEAGLGRDIPIVLGKYALELPFVQQILRRGAFRDRVWVIPEHEYIRAKSVIYCRTGRPYRERLDYLLDEMDVAVPATNDGRRLFLTRGKGGTRRILNEDAVMNLLSRYGFTPVDTSGMSVDQQIDTFSQARYLVAAHGAGVTNIIYRRTAPLGVLELHGSAHISQDFWRICAQYGHWWEHLAGDPDGPDPKHANFTIDIEALEAALDRMMYPSETVERTLRGQHEPAILATSR